MIAPCLEYSPSAPPALTAIITYIHGEGYAAGELKHGPLALIDKDIPVVVVIPPGESYRKTMSNLEEVKSRGANVLAIGSCDDESLKSKANNVIGINGITSFIFFVEGDLVRQRLAARKVGHIVPLLCIVGYLHFAVNGFVNPA